MVGPHVPTQFPPALLRRPRWFEQGKEGHPLPPTPPPLHVCLPQVGTVADLDQLVQHPSDRQLRIPGQVVIDLEDRPVGVLEAGS